MAKSQILIDAKELRELMVAIRKASERTIQMVDRAVDESAILLQSEAVEKIQKGTRSGKPYRRGGKRAVRSAPGEPPKTDTGVLVSSIRPDFSGTMQAEVGSLANIAPYGEYLEDPKQMNRPWLAPTLEENRGKINGKIAEAIRKGGLAK